ncbi:MAG: hypothetical protein JWO05_2592 [Gemmatimonadetes bacterium]|nr:hypothetical protein [Gemmatimonadota bacterium]
MVDRGFDNSLWATHTFVEFRSRGGARHWCVFARVCLTPHQGLARMLATSDAAHGQCASCADRGIPGDASTGVLDEYTWRVAAERGTDAPNIIPVSEAARWLAQGTSRRWPASDATRVTDPRWSHATWLSTRELSELMTAGATRDPEGAAPEVHAVWRMMEALDDRYEVRVVVWFERRAVLVERVGPGRPASAWESARRGW